jgi:4-amino-4-deoxy-L-arabinose transferase-like glycosyltransferase
VRFWLLLLVVCALALMLRVYHLDAQSLWYDEGISAHQVTRSFGEIADAAGQDTHPPLYYWLLKIWGARFGQTEDGLRSLSVVFGVASVGLTFAIGRRLFGLGAAFVAALIVACAPLAVYYSQEVRMYSQVLGFGLLASWAYLRRMHWLYALAGAATIYSHYLGFAFLAALNLHALLWWRRLDRGGWLFWLGANAVIALLFLPWLPTFLQQSTGRALNTSPRTLNELTIDTISGYGGGLTTGDLAVAGGVLLVALAVIGLVLGLQRAPLRFGTSLALLLWLVPLGLVEVLGIREGLFELRYLVVSMPGLALLAGLGVAGLATLPGRLFARNRDESGTLWPAAVASCISLLLVGSILIPASDGLLRQYFDPSLARDDYRSVVHTIEQSAEANDAVVLAAPNQEEVFDFYYHGSLPVVPLPAQRPIDPNDTRRRLEALKADHDRVWLVSWAMNEADPHSVIDSWLAQNGFEASHQWFGGVQLELITLGNEQAALEPVNATFDNGVTLIGYRLNTRQPRRGDALQISLVWQAKQPPAQRWTVFTHLLNGEPKVVAQRDAEPDGGLRPTTSWAGAEQVQDNYGIVVPDDLASGTYTLEVGMYQADHRARLPDGGDRLLLGTVQVD